MGTGEVQRTITGHTNMIYLTIFSPDEKLMASSSRDLTARIWDVATGRELQKLNGFRCSVKAVAYSPNGQMLAAAGRLVSQSTQVVATSFCWTERGERVSELD